MLLTTERPERQHGDAEVLHPLSAEDRAVVAAMRAQIEPFKGTMTGPEARVAYDGIMEQTPDAPGVGYERGAVGGVPGIWCRPRTAAPGVVILYLHGGSPRPRLGARVSAPRRPGRRAGERGRVRRRLQARSGRPLSGRRGRCAGGLSRPRRSGSTDDRDCRGLVRRRTRARGAVHHPGRSTRRHGRRPARRGRPVAVDGSGLDRPEYGGASGRRPDADAGDAGHHRRQLPAGA